MLDRAEGVTDGLAVRVVGLLVGLVEGPTVVVGRYDGGVDGISIGVTLGLEEGTGLGRLVERAEGIAVGRVVGCDAGASDSARINIDNRTLTMKSIVSLE